MGRLVCLIGRSATGEFLDAVTGKPLGCVAEGPGIDAMVRRYAHLRGLADGVIASGKHEVRLTELRMLATHTAGGEFKAPRKWR